MKPSSMRPLFQFLLLGSLIFAADRWLLDHGDPPARTVIEISADQLAAFRRSALASSGRLPDEAELRALIDAEVAEEMLYREALALDLPRRDEVVRRRLVRNMRFLRPEDERSDDALFQEALGLGMEQSDLVARRRLIQRMRLAIEALGRATEPTETELAAYLARHPERFSSPPRASFSHVFVDPARRGRSAEAEARELLAGLRAAGDGASTGTGAGLGDPFLVPRDDALHSERELAKLYGPDFARSVMDLAPGRWEGPLPSSHGLHLVRVRERRPGAPISLASVRGEVRYALLAERGEQALGRAIDELRRRYQVRIAE
jgi:parvulin-like peptidyl-prolyl isomerase